MNIRQALPSDSLLLSSLSADVQRLHAENHPNIFKMPNSNDFAVSFFNEILVDSIIKIFIAEDDGRAFGCVVCKLVENPENAFTVPMRYLLIDQISVRPEVQGKGIGRALIERVEVLAKEFNVSRIQLDSWSFNTQAHAFFEKLGFEMFNHRFWRNL